MSAVQLLETLDAISKHYGLHEETAICLVSDANGAICECKPSSLWLSRSNKQGCPAAVMTRQ